MLLLSSRAPPGQRMTEGELALSECGLFSSSVVGEHDVFFFFYCCYFYCCFRHSKNSQDLPTLTLNHRRSSRKKKMNGVEEGRKEGRKAGRQRERERERQAVRSWPHEMADPTPAPLIFPFCCFGYMIKFGTCMCYY